MNSETEPQQWPDAGTDRTVGGDATVVARITQAPQVDQLMRELSYQRALHDLLVARRQAAEDRLPQRVRTIDYWTREAGTNG